VKEEHPRHYVLSVRAVPYRRGRPLARRERGELIPTRKISCYYFNSTVYLRVN
jgi:hypothetical protein